MIKSLSRRPPAHPQPARTERSQGAPKPPAAKAASVQKEAPKMPKLGHSTRDTFERLDRNNNHHIDLGELVAPHRLPRNPGPIKGDTNHNGSVSYSEFKALQKHAVGKPASSSQGGGSSGTRPMHETFKMPEGQSATFRTHASGMVLGRVQAGDKFVASHAKGDWVYGHVKGHPERKGWVLRSGLPKDSKPSTAQERAEGTRNAVDLRQRAGGLDYTTGKDKKVLEYLQQDLGVGGARKIAYTTPVQPKDPTQPITVYANYPCNKDSVLKRDGKPVQIPAGQDVKFRYTPDGKHAIVLLNASKKNQGIWGVVPMSQLNVPPGTLGAKTPEHPIRH